MTATIAPFKGTTAYAAANQPTTTAQSSHTTGGVAAQTPTTDCLGCHNGLATAPAFLAAGFVASAANGTTGAAAVQVSVYNATLATAFTAYTDTDGYFWINPPATGATGTFCAGVRETTEVDMPQTETNYDCQSSSCHGGTTPGPIHYP